MLRNKEVNPSLKNLKKVDRVSLNKSKSTMWRSKNNESVDRYYKL